MNARSSLTRTETLKLDDAKVVIVDETYTSVLKNVYQSIFVDRTYADTREPRKSRASEEQDEFLEKILELEHSIISAHKPLVDIVITKNYEVERGSRSKRKWRKEDARWYKHLGSDWRYSSMYLKKTKTS